MSASTSDTTAADASGPADGEAAYTLWYVLRREVGEVAATGQDDLAEVSAVLEELAGRGVTTRGLYDVSGLRADADLMLWLHGPRAEDLQSAVRTLRRTRALSGLRPEWSAMGVHRDAEFTASHQPSFMKGRPPAGWVTVYPFVRSYEWYLLPEEERRQMLADHGRRGARHRTVLSNTVAAFALGDFEWVLALEDDDPANLVDLMRDLRYTEARRHVRLETPFFMGRRIAVDELAEVLS